MQIISLEFVCFDLDAFMVAKLLDIPSTVYMVCSTLEIQQSNGSCLCKTGSGALKTFWSHLSLFYLILCIELEFHL